MGAFERTFAMKFGRLSIEQQVTLLETKYLAGKALKAFRGLVETEKDSVRSILRALANRLRISAEDETRRAKTRWELLRISENQSVEDFCLLLDEVARVAYRRLPPEELSSLKTAKLLEAIAGSEALRCMIDAKLLESPVRPPSRTNYLGGGLPPKLAARVTKLLKRRTDSTIESKCTTATSLELRKQAHRVQSDGRLLEQQYV
uniref:Uncharacterized protein n=1 Tax=Caenorhabditis japonica TaxID=281687 RepID=A0A8R1HXZ3_CAEJA